MLRKVYLAIECATDKECDETQLVLNEISCSRIITAERLLKAYPLYKQREGEIRSLFAVVAQNGIKGLLSMQGVSVLTQLIKK